MGLTEEAHVNINICLYALFMCYIYSIRGSSKPATSKGPNLQVSYQVMAGSKKFKSS